ncbi:GH23220 [Drosophila grimshawi]|uniref:GH23220 n=1 Tax=Drosophila grimshawi TaxID=7222 RepID=B4K402_DROGR|nr:GH23220 [Drosophila grimshawi]
MYSHLLGHLFIVENDKLLNNYFNSLVQEIRKMSLVTVYRQQVVSRQLDRSSAKVYLVIELARLFLIGS